MQWSVSCSRHFFQIKLFIHHRFHPYTHPWRTGCCILWLLCGPLHALKFVLNEIHAHFYNEKVCTPHVHRLVWMDSGRDLPSLQRGVCNLTLQLECIPCRKGGISCVLFLCAQWSPRYTYLAQCRLSHYVINNECNVCQISTSYSRKGNWASPIKGLAVDTASMWNACWHTLIGS